MATPAGPLPRNTTVTLANPTPPTNIPVVYQGTPPTQVGLVPQPLPEHPEIVTPAGIFLFADPLNGAVKPFPSNPTELAGRAEGDGAETKFDHPSGRLTDRGVFAVAEPFSETPNSSHPSNDAGDDAGDEFGPELVINGDFSSAGGWTLTFATVSGGLLHFNGTGVDLPSAFRDAAAGVTAIDYRYSFDVVSMSAPVDLMIFVGGNGLTIPITATGTYSGTITGLIPDLNITIGANSTTFVGDIDNFSVRQIL